MHYVSEHMKLPMKFRLKSKEPSHFKLLVLFVFTVYGILVPLWFAFHGNKLLGNNDQWKKVVRSSTRIAWSQIEHFDNKKKGHIGLLVLNKTKHIKSAAKRRSRKHKATGPKPLYRYQFWPKVQQPSQKITYHPGRLLSMEWEHLCCQSINCLRKFPLFPLLPSKKTFLKRLKLSKKGALYGQRIAGLLKPPESGSYTIYMKCLSTCEFWLSDNEYPLRSKLLKKIVRGIPVEHDSKVNDSFSRSLLFKATLQTGRAYFMDVLLTIYRYIKRPFEVLWKLPRSDRFVPLSSKFFTGFNKNPESLKNMLRLYSHSPSVHLSPFLESIEEPGDDDDDFTILGGKNHDVNETFMDYQRHPIYVNSTLQYGNLLSFPRNIESPPILKECANMPSFLRDKTLKKYAGVWKTTFSSVFPRDTTDHMMCIGNRYPKDCQGNEVVSRETVSSVLTLYSKALSDSSIRTLGADDHVVKKDFKDSGIKIQHLVNVVEKVDLRNGSLLLVDAITQHPTTNSTYLVSQYLYLDKNRSSLCLARGYTINWDVTVNVVIVAKRENSWLLHFLSNMEKIFVKTNDKKINVIIAKYGNDNVRLMEEYQRNRLPSIRTVRHRGVFDKRRAIQSAVKKIKDQNSIVFLMDLHILIPDTIIQLVRKYTIKGHMVFNPVLFRLSHCGSPASSRIPPRGFWESFGYGILGIYKSDWDNLGSMTTKKYKKGWGGEDWELLDRIFAAGLGVQRIRVPNFYHFYHSKKGMWN